MGSVRVKTDGILKVAHSALSGCWVIPAPVILTVAAQCLAVHARPASAFANQVTMTMLTERAVKDTGLELHVQTQETAPWPLVAATVPQGASVSAAAYTTNPVEAVSINNSLFRPAVETLIVRQL